MLWTEWKPELQTRANQLFKGIRLHEKKGWFWEVVGWLLFFLSFRKLRRENFRQMAVCIGNHHFYPPAWGFGSVRAALVHETEHTRWCAALGLWIHPLLGFPLFAILYLLAPLPLGFAYFRFRAELAANLAEWKYLGYSGENLTWMKELFIEKVSGSSYFWAVPEKLARTLINNATREMV